MARKERDVNLDIVERQAHAWESRRRAVEESLAHATPCPRGGGPYVTISRQHGSGGATIAREIARRLDFKVYDREIIQQIAAETRVAAPLIERRDERATTALDDFLAGLVIPQDPGEAGFITELFRVVNGIAKNGRAVILGRGGNWFLEPTWGVRARLVAPEEVRAARIAERDGLTAAVARRRVHDLDNAQRAFIRQVFHRDIDDPCGYDLVVNTAAIPADAVVDIIVAGLARRVV